MIHLPIMSYRRHLNFQLLTRNTVLLRLSALFFHRFVQLHMDVASKQRLPLMITAEALLRVDKSLLLTTQVAKYLCVLATTEEFLVLEYSPLLVPMPVPIPTGQRGLVLEVRACASKCRLHSPAVPLCRHPLQPPARVALSSLPSSIKDLARDTLLTLRWMVARRTGCKLFETSSILTIYVYNATSPAYAFTLFTHEISVEYDFMRHGGDTVTMMTFLILFSVSFPILFH